MSNRLFKVDLSDGARDFKPTATEPGLAMLDRNNANYSILRRWLGDFAAEPEWMGQDVHFFVREEARGRLENVHCTPCTKADLLGPLQPQLEEIDQKLRRAKPETANEQLIHRIMRKKFGDLTADYDASDFHCHFFKYRQGSEPWRLIWVWGYQRTDVEPARSIICGSPECEALYARRPKQKARCPVCASSATRGKKPPPPLWMRVAQLALLLLLLLGGAAFLLALAMNQPRLVVTPDDWSGPPGSRVQYKVEHKRYIFWNDDVTAKVVPQSHDKRIVRFEPHGALAKARAPGNTFVTFRFKDLSSDATASVGQPLQPASIKLEPAGEVKLAVGSTKQLKLIGTYDKKDNLDPVDLSELAQWNVEKPEVVFAHHGKLEGATEGVTKINVQYRASDKDEWLTAATNAVVTQVDYKSIELAVEPKSFGMGQSGRIDVFGLDAQGTKYSLLGSSLLKLNVTPADIAKVEGDYLVGVSKSEGTLEATLHDLSAQTTFTVGNSELAAGTFAVMPTDIKLHVNEYVNLDVISASSAPIETVSSKPEIVEVIGPREIAGRAAGKATVTLTQGGKSETVNVTVAASNIVTLHFDPPTITLVSGVASPVRVYARDKSGAEIDVAPDRITWVKQPPLEYAELDRGSLALFGITPTSDLWPLIAQLGTNEEIQAEALVSVVSSPLVSTSIVELGGDEFLVHPPVRVVGGRTVLLDTGVATQGAIVYGDNGVLIGDGVSNSELLSASGLRKGYTIISHEGRDLTGMSQAELVEYFNTHPIQYGHRIGYRGLDGAGGLVKLGVTSVGVVQEVRLLGVSTDNVTAGDFNASLDLDLREEAQYRITDAAGEPLTDWQDLGPTPLTTVTTAKIPRNASDRYELFIERKIADAVDRYQLRFTLTENGM